MVPARSKSQPAFEAEILILETEMTRVVALSTTSNTDRANLADWLQRLKTKAGMPLT